MTVMIERTFSVIVSAVLMLIAQAAGAACLTVAERDAPVRLASLKLAEIAPGHVGITFVGHASFLIESPAGVTLITDYNGYNRAGRTPDIVTMNNSHSTHFTHVVEPGITHVLRGWDPAGGVARHEVRVQDMVVRSVPTNLSDFGGHLRNGNAIFVIEVAGLCIAHLSHLHHVLSPDQLADIGLVDILFAPIDGMWTMSHAELFNAIERIQPRLVIPMHLGSGASVAAFVALAETSRTVRHHPSDTVVMSRRLLPRTDEVLFLKGF